MLHCTLPSKTPVCYAARLRKVHVRADAREMRASEAKEIKKVGSTGTLLIPRPEEFYESNNVDGFLPKRDPGDFPEVGKLGQPAWTFSIRKVVLSREWVLQGMSCCSPTATVERW